MTRIITAEFLAAVFLLGLGTFLDAPKPDQPPENVVFSHLVRLTAVCVVYAVLALLSNGDRVGRVAVAFGGLVLLGVVFAERALVDAIAKRFKDLGGLIG